MSNLLVSHIPAIDLRNTKDSIKLDSIKTQINAINCIDTLITKWKSVLSLYVKFIKDGEISQKADKEVLIALSMDCADIYGDAIYLARAMANTFTDTYFDIYDDCHSQCGPRTKKNNGIAEQIEIFPNPTSGIVTIMLPPHYEGQAVVYNTNGQQLRSINITDSDVKEIDLSGISGVFYVQFRSQEGDVMTKKIIVIK